jgi:hypothetical protein
MASYGVATVKRDQRKHVGGVLEISDAIGGEGGNRLRDPARCAATPFDIAGSVSHFGLEAAQLGRVSPRRIGFA